jgi:putative transposase
MKRISAPEQTREYLRALIEGRLGTAPARSSLVLLAARLILEEALEGEVRDEIGRERYERADGEAKGYRNGYRPGQMKTAEGMVEFSAPQVRDTPEPFVSAIRENLAGRTQALEDLAVELMHAGCRPATSKTPSGTRAVAGFCRVRQ